MRTRRIRTAALRKPVSEMRVRLKKLRRLLSPRLQPLVPRHLAVKRFKGFHPIPRDEPPPWNHRVTTRHHRGPDSISSLSTFPILRTASRSLGYTLTTMPATEPGHPDSMHRRSARIWQARCTFAFATLSITAVSLMFKKGNPPLKPTYHEGS